LGGAEARDRTNLRLQQQRPEGPDPRNRLEATRGGIAPHRRLDVPIQLLNLRRQQGVVR
jgi:hypothetical protein